MHAGLLDVFHDPADDDVLAVAVIIDHGVNVDLDGVVEKAVEQYWRIVRDFDRLAHIALEIALLVHDLHRPPAQHIRWAHDQRITDLLCRNHCLAFRASCSVRRLAELQIVQEVLKTFAVFGHVDHVRRRADDRDPVPLQIARELERRLPAELDDHAVRLLDVDDLEHVLERQWLEVQAVGSIVVSRDGLRIAVDHDRFVAVFAQRERRVHAAVVEFDALSDAVRPAAKDDDFLAASRLRFALVLVRGIHVRGPGRKLGRTGIDALVYRTDAQRVTARAHFGFGLLPQMREAPVGKSHALERPQLVGAKIVELALFDRELGVDDLLDLRQEPAIDPRVVMNLLERHADAESIGDVPQALGAGVRQLVGDGIRVHRLQVEAVDAGLQPAQRFLQRFLECAADRHHLADRFHLRGQPVVGLREFLEGEARHLGDDIIDGRLERRRRRSARDVVLQFV